MPRSEFSPTTAPDPISLLWPEPTTSGSSHPARINADTAADLDLARLVDALADAHGYHTAIRNILLYLCDDADVIRYRQDVFADLLEQPALADALAALLPKIQDLNSLIYSARPDQSSLYEIVWRVGQLEAYVEVVNGLQEVFAQHGARLRAAGLLALRERILAIARDETFEHLTVELPKMIQNVRGIASITIGVNLDDQLRPSEATLLSVNNRKFQGAGSSILGVLFGRAADADNWEGIAALHSAKPSTPVPNAPGVKLDNPMMYPLFRDLAEVTKRSVRPVAASLGRYVRININFLDDIGTELAFYIGAVRLVERLRAAGLPVCRPVIAPPDERVCVVENAYNVNLALRLLNPHSNGNRSAPANVARDIVLNAIHFDEAGRIFVLTGPNQGGKTTYTQAVGLVHVLAGAGLFVPGSCAEISLVDGIFTHFPVEERPDAGVGRLGEEAQRLNTIFANATRYSLVLMNESLSSTSPGESLYLARDVVRALRMLGARAIFATHLHDLAADADALNAETPGDSAIISLVSLAVEDDDLLHDDDMRQTYKIVAGPPRGRSYAREIAARYGISFEQLTRLLNRRGVVED